MSHPFPAVVRRTHVMLAPDQAVTDFALPAIDLRAAAKRVALPAAGAVLAIAALVLLGGRVHTFTAAATRIVDGSPGWVAAGIMLEAMSLAGYVGLLSLVAGRASGRISIRESAQITLAGAAATRVLPTAGAGGAALTIWTLRRAGLRTAAAMNTLLVFFVLLYAVFLAAIVAAGSLLILSGRGPAALSAIPAAAAALSIAVALAAGSRRGIAGAARLRPIGRAVAEARSLLRAGEVRLAGAAGYWLCDAAVLWAMLHAFGSPPPLQLVVLAYFVGQVANTVPLPGSVSGGMAGVLVAFGVPLGVALPAVLAYRTIAVWLPTPAAILAIPGLRATTARWAREDA